MAQRAPPNQQRRAPQRRAAPRPSSSSSSFCAPTCPNSIVFLGFVGFYVCSFLWDAFVLQGGYLALAVVQHSTCVDRVGMDDINPETVLVLLFAATFHAISLVWIMGFMHSKTITDNWLGGELQDVPRQWPRVAGIPCDWALAVPFACYFVLLLIEFGLSFHVYQFVEDLMEVEPEAFVERFCVGYEDTEEAYEWLQISLFFFLATFFMLYVFCCLLRIGINDGSMMEAGQQPLHNIEMLSSEAERQARPLQS